MSTIDPKHLSQIRYRCIGPTRGGRVVAVAADPQNQSVYYFGACAGGVWKSDDAGQYWENISDGQMNTASVGALAVAPSDPNVVYAGMGEATIRIDVSHGDGVYKSTDAGATWKHMGLEESRHIGEIRVHPNDPDTVYVAALGHMSKDNPERGLYRSTDGGETWELVLFVSDGAGAVDVSLDPNNPRILFATVWQARRTFWSMDSGGPDCGLWRSRDGGDTWENISANHGLPDGTLGKIGVSVSPAQSGRVFALIEAEGRKRGLYRSDDTGETWEKVSSNPVLGWRPWYYMHVIAHPTEADTVFVMNMKAWKSIDGGKEFEELHTPHGDNHALWIDPEKPDRMIGCDDGGAWVSLNAGGSWSTIYNQLTAQFYHVATDDQYPYLVYGSQQDNSSIAVPSRTGKGAINWADCYPPGTAESGYVAPKPGDPNIIYVGAIGSSPGGGDALQRYDHTTKQIQLVSVWPEAVHDGNTAEVRFQWTYPIMFSPHDVDVLYATGNKVFRSTDEGHSWEAISPDLTYADPDTMGVSGPLTMDTAGAEMYATIFSFMPSAHQPGVLMAGSDDGLVHVSTNNGADWQNVTPPDLAKFSQVTMLAESPHNDGTVYMTVARHKMGDYAPYVYKTTDLGQSWTLITDGLPENEFCRVVREDPNREGLLYVGTELGLHVSFDGGAHWQPLQANLPVCPVYDLVIKDTDLVVATHGRSFWILDDLTQVHQIADGLAGADRHLLKPRAAVRAPEDLFAGAWDSAGGKNYHVTIGQNSTYYVDEADTGHKTKRMLDAGDDIERGVRVTYWLAEAPEDEAVLSILDANGNEIDSFPSTIPESKADRTGLYITAAAGMNSFQWPMRYPAGTKMVDTEYHQRPQGPLATPGRYQARLTIGDWSMTQDFELVRDPRVTTSDADFAEQFDLLLQIRDKLTEVVEAVNQGRSLKAQLASWQERLEGNADAADAVAAVAGLADKLEAVEGELVQAELTSRGDALNYREMLFEKLSSLPPVVASADTRPTKQSYEVFNKLAAQIDEQLALFGALTTNELAALNDQLSSLGVGIIGV
ncbi:MAG: glycosyl hydrolase [Actinomycetia bacterium]|nr:glycosyl hydrolase [Actinomycetes bacterium]